MGLLIGAFVVVVILAGVAIYYQLRLREMRRHQEEQRQALAAEGKAQRKRVIKSIYIIAQGVLDDQLTMTEGAIRIKVLLDGLDVDDQLRESYQAFYHLAAATDHIPILEAWKKLSTKQKLVFDKQRTQLESDHREFVVDACKRILQQQF
ncbi:DUF2489 domain-containing protein [Pseudomaricurvus alkylphenolicus]|jgi:hypothetical protein|uniref:DUF2489 domain-containing protein n=1 Tax=Pseudomaricurvus alkylphenolicus TaxID=1306991 RepID=UPI001423C41C|nr:DUF2489 domain-containing protein [Pseudomaricurvus alkylphenolicus]NIB41142.1 DUF2489 domain-containing protein [Pseudomaricurvus alkylphenolicus]